MIQDFKFAVRQLLKAPGFTSDSPYYGLFYLSYEHPFVRVLSNRTK